MITLRYKDTPNDVEEETLHQKFGFRIVDLRNGQVGSEAIDVIQNEFGKDANIWRGNLHNKSEDEKLKKVKELQKLGHYV